MVIGYSIPASHTILSSYYKLARHASNKLMVAFSLRFHELYEHVSRLLEEKLGPVVMQWHVVLGRVPRVSWVGGKRLSSGVIGENAVHVLYFKSLLQMVCWSRGRGVGFYVESWRGLYGRRQRSRVAPP